MRLTPDDYKKKLIDLAKGDDRIIFTGFVFGSEYKALQQNAFAYIHATEVGGTQPALIEAMGFGNCVLSFETPENAEVVGTAGLMYSNTNELRRNAEYSGKRSETGAKV